MWPKLFQLLLIVTLAVDAYAQMNSHTGAPIRRNRTQSPQASIQRNIQVVSNTLKLLTNNQTKLEIEMSALRKKQLIKANLVRLKVDLHYKLQSSIMKQKMLEKEIQVWIEELLPREITKKQTQILRTELESSKNEEESLRTQIQEMDRRLLQEENYEEQIQTMTKRLDDVKSNRREAERQLYALKEELRNLRRNK